MEKMNVLELYSEAMMGTKVETAVEKVVGKAMERIGKFIISDFQKGIRLGFLKSFF
jgi:hypothetical protein